MHPDLFESVLRPLLGHFKPIEREKERRPSRAVVVFTSRSPSWPDGAKDSDESSSVFLGPQLPLPCSDSSAVELDQSRLPFLYQLRGLTRAALGTGKHSLRMDALLCRLVELSNDFLPIFYETCRGSTMRSEASCLISGTASPVFLQHRPSLHRKAFPECDSPTQIQPVGAPGLMFDRRWFADISALARLRPRSGMENVSEPQHMP